VLEEDPENARGDGSHQQEHRQPLRRPLDPASHCGREEALDDVDPLRPVNDQQRTRRAEVQEHEEWDE